MGVEAPANNALRTIWTTAMDRFFIDLMLEQVGQGSRVDGHLFSKRAWRHMTSLFNEKFQLQYSRDHLKNRHKTLRRIYRSVKNLLEQNGFTWDETQQIVTADNRVWNNYTKAHPDARSYRTKSIPYYDDMCNIFKIASTGRQNDSTHNQDNNKYVQRTKIDGMMDGLQSSTTSVSLEDQIDDEKGLVSTLDGTVSISELDEQQLIMPATSLLSGNDGMVNILHEMVIVETNSANGNQENTSFSAENVTGALQTDRLDGFSGSRSRTYWQPPMDNYFIELMLEQVRQGNQFDGTFRKHAWVHMTELFNVKFGYKYDTVVLKNRHKTLKRQYTAIKILLDQKGFVWDDTRKMVTADDHIWHDYITPQVHPDAKQYITKPVPYLNNLSVIFKDASVDEGHSKSAYNVDQQSELLDIESDGAFGFQQPLLTVATDIDQRDSDISHESNKRKFATPSTCQNSKKTRMRFDEGIMDALPDTTIDVVDKQNKHVNMLQSCSNEVMVNALREMAAVVSSLSEKRIEPNNSTSTEVVIRALQDTPDLDDDLILDACDLLEDEKKAKTFLSLDIRLRKKWLMRKLRPSAI